MSEYVILRHQRLYIPVDLTEKQDVDAAEPDAREIMDWLPVRGADGKIVRMESDSQQLAVEEYGKKFKVNGGRYKAIAMVNWRGVIPLAEVTELRTTTEEDDDL